MAHFFNFGFDPRGGMPERPSGPIDNTTLYKDLGLEKGADARDIKRAYRKLARTHHPDKGGDEATFKKVQHAYDVLKDEEKRKLYDEGGEAALEKGASMSEMMRRQQRRGDDVPCPIQVSLNDLYNGKTKKLRLTRKKICVTCDGKGGTAVQQCGQCQGRKFRVMIRQIGPGLATRVRVECEACDGEGVTIKPANRCRTCKGNKTVKEQKDLEVFIPRGAKHNKKIIFKEHADEEPGTVPGDVVVIVQEKKHSTFLREGKHLVYKKTITLAEALTGFCFYIEHLDGRILKVDSEPNSVTKHGSFKVIRDEGMPWESNPSQRGNLYIEFKVEFPDAGAIQPNEKKIKAALPAAPAKTWTPTEEKEMEIHNLVDVDIEVEKRRYAQERKAQHRNREAYEQDEEGEGFHGQAQECPIG